MTKEELIAFEEEIKELFLAKKIRAPIHLSRGNEEPLILLFAAINPRDWVFSTHRSHYHALLKGISPKWLKEEILAGRSMHIMSPEHNFFSAAIVAGTLPIAVGVAMAIKRRGQARHVHCFVGDMAAAGGAFYEATKYSKNHKLPIRFIIEDNGLSTDTPTAEVWGDEVANVPEGVLKIIDSWENGLIMYYKYSRIYPHVGCGTFVHF